ncbi:MAG: hypothetical protein ACRCR9_04395 [Chitinophagaceae bacterium]
MNDLKSGKTTINLADAISHFADTFEYQFNVYGYESMNNKI